MDHHLTLNNLPADGERLEFSRAAKAAFVLLGIGGIGLAASAWYFLAAPEKLRDAFSFSWLLAVFFVFTITCGGIFWTLLHHATNSGWGIAVRRVMESVGNMIPVVGILALPLLLPDVRHDLWHWMGIEQKAIAASRDAAVQARYQNEHEKQIIAAQQMEKSAREAGQTAEAELAAAEVARLQAHAPTEESILKAELGDHHTGDALLKKKYAYLNTTKPWGFFGRFFAYFILLTIVIKVVRHFSLTQDKQGGVKYTFLARRLSCGFLIIFALSITFASIDWVKALNHHWFSTMWGVYVFAGSAGASMAAIILATTWLKSLGHLHIVNEEHYHVKGKLLFAFTVFWAYIAFSQFFLIWYANMTEETQWYLTRNTETYNTLNIALVVFRFAVPFLLLLPAWVKRTPRYLAAMAAYILCVHLLDLYIMIIPQRGPAVTHGENWYVPGATPGDVVAVVTVACLVAGAYILSLRKNSLYACRDPRLMESLHLHN